MPRSDALRALALDLRSSFNHASDRLWELLDADLWNLTRNPWFVLQTVSREKLRRAMADPETRRLVARLARERREAERAARWFEEAHPHPPISRVAYFSMEFMLSEALPIYSGGLGNVAGDVLKTANDLAVPIVGVGLLYQRGYFRQEITPTGRQQAMYPFNDPGQLPTTPVRKRDGEWVRFGIDFRGSSLWIRTWQVRIGRVRLYLLDTNDPANTPANRAITSELYGGDAELRLRQEIVLGIGGWRMLRAIGLNANICHLNEGHAALAVLERARGYMTDERQPFDVALAVTRAGNVFTTHTPVDAGFDRFAPDLITRYLGPYAEQDLKITVDDLLALGRRQRGDAAEPFNMAYLALRGSGAVNGVSRLHGDVSRRIFQPLFPRWPTVEVPVAYVTNGVHTPTWDSAEADRLWEATCGKDCWRWKRPNVGSDLRRVTDLDLWRMRTAARAALVAYVRERTARQLAEHGAPSDEIAAARTIFDPQVLTLGFARRFATYKRPNLLLHDRDRLARILLNRQRPVQLVVAGKAHPNDSAGQLLIEEWIAFIRRADVRGRVVFLADYDMLVAERLIQGVDVWINTPRRPWEACGTSGMKVLVNGGLNLSELDGWWAEAYAPEVGWAIGDGQDRGEDPAWDAAEADAVYALLEGDVAEAFYTRDGNGIPGRWIARMRESMARLTPAFSGSRMVRQYVEEYYLPAASAYHARAADRARRGVELVAWKNTLERHWSAVRFVTLDVHSKEGQHVFRATIELGALHPDEVRVELYAEAQRGGELMRIPMTLVAGSPDSTTRYLYASAVPASRPATDFTPRIVPVGVNASVPLEAPFIRWCD